MTGDELLAAYARGIRCFRGADLRGAHIMHARLKGADLRSTDLRRAYLGGANLRNTDFEDASLRGAYCGSADFRGANLAGVLFDGADLLDATFSPGLVLAGRASRGDYEFFAWWTPFGSIIRAGCRTWLSMSDARERYAGGHERQRESLDILDYLEKCLDRVTAEQLKKRAEQ